MEVLQHVLFGCKNRIEQGTRYGKLVVLNMTDKKDKNSGSVMYQCQCDCGEICTVAATELRALRKTSCSKCKQSYGSSKIEFLLKQNNIDFIKEYCFIDCVNPETKQKFRFDFYIVDKNYIIEFDGEQHFKEVSIWGGKEGLKKRQLYDKIKNEYCIKNNIGLIRIPYTIQNKITIQDLLIEYSNYIIK